MTWPRRLFRPLILTVVALLGTQAACQKADAPAAGTTTINVFAAASLTEALTEVGKLYEQSHEPTRVQLNFGSSSTLATQVLNGAPADVFASADEPNMKKVVDAGIAKAAPRTFALNEMVIVVAKGNPKGIATLADLTRPGLTVAAGAAQVPAGRYAREVFTKAHLTFPATASQELDVKQVVGRVALGEADAGLAYATDGGSEQRVMTIVIPPEFNVTARYPAASLSVTGQPFVDFLLSDQAQKVLRTHGFLAPT